MATYDIFICYTKANLTIVELIYKTLMAKDYSVFYDRRIHGGERWELHIHRMLDSSRCMLVIVSEVKNNSKYMDDEMEYFRQKRLNENEYDHRIIPIIIEPNIAMDNPTFFGISTYQSIDFSKWDNTKDAIEFQDLIEAINKRIARAKHLSEINPNPLDLQQLEQELAKANEIKQSIENQMAVLKLQPENKDIISVKRSISRAQAIYERGINEQLDISLTKKSKKYLDELIQIHNNFEITNLKTIQQQTRLNAAYEEIKDKIANIEAKIIAHNV